MYWRCDIPALWECAPRLIPFYVHDYGFMIVYSFMLIWELRLEWVECLYVVHKVGELEFDSYWR